MEIRVLRYFLAVVQEESMTKAAELLHLTQPTLSRQIAQMEEEMGVRLFDRSSRKLVLTDEGLLLRRRAEEILELVDKTERNCPNGMRWWKGRYPSAVETWRPCRCCRHAFAPFASAIRP